MKLVVFTEVLEKGRPAVPEGTRRQHTQMRNGKPTKVWVKKLGKKWVYDGTVDTKQKVSHVGERSEIREAHASALKEADVKKAQDQIAKTKPPAEALAQLMEDPSYGVTGKTLGAFADYGYKMAMLGAASLNSKMAESFFNAVAGADTALELDKLGNEWAIDAYNNAPKGDKDYAVVIAKIRDAQHLKRSGMVMKGYADYATWLQWSPSSNMKSDENGMLVNYNQTHSDQDIEVAIPFDVAEEFIKKAIRRGKRLTKAEALEVSQAVLKLKGTDGYRKWKAQNPKIQKAMESFKENVGVEFKTTAYSNEYGGTKVTAVDLTVESINKMETLMTEFSEIFSLKNYKTDTPLSIRFSGQSAGVAGFYANTEKSLNISPEMPGTITHEVGHYMYAELGVEGVQEFSKWVEESGLREKIRVAVTGVHAKEEFRGEVEYTHRSWLSGIDKDNVDLFKSLPEADVDAIKGFLSLSGRIAVDDFAQSLGDHMKSVDLMPTQPDEISNSGAIMATSEYAAGRDPMAIQAMTLKVAELVESNYDVKHMIDASKNHLSKSLSVTERMFKQTSSTGYTYTKGPEYYHKDTEIFARTFRQYSAMKSELPEYRSMKDIPFRDEMRLQGTIHGAGTPEVDPTYAMFADGKFEALLKKKFGESLLKALVEVLEKGRPAVAEGTRRQHTQMRGGLPTLVWVKKLGKKWVYDGMVNAKNTSKNVGARSTVRKKHEESKAPQKKLMDDVDLKGALSMDEADFRIHAPDGFAYDSYLNHEADRHSNAGKITVGPKFFNLDLVGKKHTIAHELAHTLESGLSVAGVNKVIDEFQADTFTGTFSGQGPVIGINGQITPLENLTEAYTVFLEEPSFLQEHYPKAYDLVKEMIGATGLPTELPTDLAPPKPTTLAQLDAGAVQAIQRRFTRRDRISEGQQIRYRSSYHKQYTGQTGKLVAIGHGGFAMVQFPDGQVKSAGWQDITPTGKIQPHSLYDGVAPENMYSVEGVVREKLDKTMKQKIGNSKMDYYDLCDEFKRKGFNLQVVGGTVRDIIGNKGAVKDVDFIFNGTDRELFTIVRQINPAWVKNAVTNKHLGLCSFTDGSDVVDITPVHKYSPEMNGMAKGWNLKDDATSRDLAMNSLQVDPLTGVLCDPTGNGIKDIESNTLNFCNPATLPIAPAYILRVFKFIGRGYKVSPETEGHIQKNLKYVSSLSPRRRESFLRRQVGDKDGLKGLENFKKTFKSYNPNIWDREFDQQWRGVYRSMGGKP